MRLSYLHNESEKKKETKRVWARRVSQGSLSDPAHPTDGRPDGLGERGRCEVAVITYTVFITVVCVCVCTRRQCRASARTHLNTVRPFTYVRANVLLLLAASCELLTCTDRRRRLIVRLIVYTSQDDNARELSIIGHRRECILMNRNCRLLLL